MKRAALRKWICANGCEYNWKMVGLSERGCRSRKKTSQPGSVSAKKSMLLVFSVFAVRTSLACIRSKTCSVLCRQLKGYNAGTRHTLGSLGRTWASTQSWLPQPQPTTALHITPTTVVHCIIINVNFKLHSLHSHV